jgi:thermolysin
MLLAGLLLPAFAVRADRGAPEAVGSPRVTVSRAVEKSADQVAAGAEAAVAGLRVRWDDRQASPSRVRGKALGRQAGLAKGGTAVSARAGDEGKALDALAGVGRLFGFRDVGRQYRARAVFRDDLGHRHVRMAQTHEGMRVVGGELVVHLDAKGEAYEVNGRHVTRLGALGPARIGRDDAIRAAAGNLGAMGLRGFDAAARPELVVFAVGDDPALAYEFVMRARVGDAASAWRYWVDAGSGAVILRYRDIRTVAAPASGAAATIYGSVLEGEGGAATTVTGWRETSNWYHYLHSTQAWWQVRNAAVAGYSDPRTYAYRTTNDWGTSDRVEMSMAHAMEETQRYYSTMFGLSSFDGAGAMAVANVHYGNKYVNAFWDSTLQAFYFGDGDGSDADQLAVLDITAHEFGHAVAEHTAAFVYAYESGALDESFADISGACVEFMSQPDGRNSYPARTAGRADWLLGEDCWLSSTALRDMRSPGNAATVGAGNEQPSRYGGRYWYSGTGDNGGVHYNSGVQNFFFYLLSEGGTGNNEGVSYSLSGIGVSNAARVAYRTVTAYCTPSTDYRSVRDAWMSAAEDLSAAWVTSVDRAWNAAGLGDMDVSPNRGLSIAGPVGGPFAPVSRVYTVTNGGVVSLSWTASHTQNWISVSPASGTLAGGGTAEVTVSLVSSALRLAQGVHTDSIVFSNSASGSRSVLAVTLRAGTRDCATELFDAADNDLAGMMLTFRPDSVVTSYAVMAEYAGALPTDPSGGTALALSDDSSVLVTLPGANRVRLFGVAYDRFYVGSNGYITFGVGDSDISESLADHFDTPRISVLFDDLYPGSIAGGGVTWKLCADRVAVTYENVPEYNSSAPNTMQVEMFFDGTIRMAYPRVSVKDGLIGLSPGGGVPAGFAESDLSSYGLPPRVTVAPASVDFGVMQVGATGEAALVLTNAGECVMEGSGSVGGAFAVSSGGSYYLAPGTTHTMRVRFAPQTAGTHAGSVYFSGSGGASCPVTGRAIGLGDQDGDGATDWEEYLAGTDATNSVDRFKVEDTRAEAGGMVIRWESVTSRWYTVCATTNLMGQWKDVYVAQGTGAEMCYTNPPSGASADFLRVRVSPTP